MAVASIKNTKQYFRATGETYGGLHWEEKQEALVPLGSREPGQEHCRPYEAIESCQEVEKKVDNPDEGSARPSRVPVFDEPPFPNVPLMGDGLPGRPGWSRLDHVTQEV